MGKFVGLKFNLEEEELLARAFAVSGCKGLGTHIKRVYFDALKRDAEVLQDIRADLDRLVEVLEGLRSVQLNSTFDPALQITLLCGVYQMVRRSVSESVRAQADAQIRLESVESILKGS